MAINYPKRYDDDFINIIKTVIDHVNAHSKTIQDLVADGQLTEEQYVSLLVAINGLLKSGGVRKEDLSPPLANEIENKRDLEAITLDDLSSETLAAIQGGEGTTFNLLSVPRDGSVTPEKTTFLRTGKNLFDKDRVEVNKSINTSTGVETASEYYDLFTLSVKPNENYTQNLSFVVAEYNNDGVYNPQTSLPYVSNYNNVRTMTTSSTASYVKMAVLKNKVPDYQFEKGTEYTGYEEYELRFKHITSDINAMLTNQDEEWVE